MPITKLEDFLNRNNVRFVRISHSLAYTAQGIAAMTHIPGKELAKTVIVNVDGNMATAVLPASAQVNLAQLKGEIAAKEVSLATESEFRSKFPDCETGAMPPFGNLYDMPVYVDENLTADQEIAFNAGSHRELIRLAYADFQRLVIPRVLKFARARKVKSAA